MDEMSKLEFFAFMPLLIYGIAIGEIIMHWRDYLKKDRRYWPHIITGVVLLELAFLNFYYLYDDLSLLFETYPKFLARMMVPITFLLTVSVFTPEDNMEVKVYFKEKMRTIFTLLGIFILAHMINDFHFDFINLIRVIASGSFFLVAFTRKFYFIWIFIVVRLALFFFNNYILNLFQ